MIISATCAKYELTHRGFRMPRPCGRLACDDAELERGYKPWAGLRASHIDLNWCKKLFVLIMSFDFNVAYSSR